MGSKYIVLSNIGNFLWEYESYGQARKGGRVRLARGDGGEDGWKDATLIVRYPDGTIQKFGRLFANRAEFQGYHDGYHDAQPEDVTVSPPEVAEAV